MNNHRLPFHRTAFPFLFALAMTVVPLLAGEMHYLPAGEPDPVALLAPPPLSDSPEQVADLAEVESVCHTAPSNEVTAAMRERKFTIFNFTPAIGDFFQPGKFPRTEEFFQHLQKDAATVTDTAKNYWKRP